MNNKLSELRTPDLYLRRVDRVTGEPLYTPCGKYYPRGKGYYSQEYVSALLARIAEFEAEEARRKLIRDRRDNIPIWQPPKHTGRGA